MRESAQQSQPLSYPAVAMSPSGFTHAARPGSVPENGWAPAFCRSTLYVSVEHLMGNDGTGTWRSYPLRATADPAAPVVDYEGQQSAEGVDCNRCRPAVAKWEREHPENQEG